MRIVSTILSIAILVSFGYIAITFGTIYAQNSTGTQTAAESLAQSSSALIGVAVSLVIAILTFLKTLLDRGILDKRVGTAVTMAADAAVAIRDNRQQISDVVQNSAEIATLIDKDGTTHAIQIVRPVLDNATQKLSEYIPKVEKFTAIANAINQNGDKTTDEIKDMADVIPERIVPTSVKKDV